jgi:hypothetical protein
MNDTLLARLATGRSAAVPIASLSELLELDAETTVDTLQGWVESGDVELWPDQPGRTLSRALRSGCGASGVRVGADRGSRSGFAVGR